LTTHFRNIRPQKFFIIDCHPYPQDYFSALKHFLSGQFYLFGIVEVYAPDSAALKRLKIKGRAGQINSVRLRYFRDNRKYIERLKKMAPSSIVINKKNFVIGADKHFKKMAAVAISDLLRKTNGAVAF
jgi:hypothetical protein